MLVLQRGAKHPSFVTESSTSDHRMSRTIFGLLRIWPGRAQPSHETWPVLPLLLVRPSSFLAGCPTKCDCHLGSTHTHSQLTRWKCSSFAEHCSAMHGTIRRSPAPKVGLSNTCLCFLVTGLPGQLLTGGRAPSCMAPRIPNCRPAGRNMQ